MLVCFACVHMYAFAHAVYTLVCASLFLLEDISPTTRESHGPFSQTSFLSGLSYLFFFSVGAGLYAPGLLHARVSNDNQVRYTKMVEGTGWGRFIV